MQNPFVQAGVILAVLLGFYGCYCYWEAGRVEFAAAFRRRGPVRQGIDDAPHYRARCRWALLASSLLSGSAFLLGR